ncbi:adhesion G protein-coupled receptor E5 [Hippoglossus stenolepis]|uniref:adhesion G protein-coupled receptor E5 n=1 Tax=Hippoglossus stenolepis TaxID=195615 RepID=UPI001FAF3BC3|nr:adhesion G protein-coupled receptor E5 [Hippoglossus stenolepis]
MAGRWNLMIPALCLSVVMVLSNPPCNNGYKSEKRECVDDDECAVDKNDPNKVGPCGEDKVCINTNGSFYCRCQDGFRPSTGDGNFPAGKHVTCQNINECLEHKDICGPNAKCVNTNPFYSCNCNDGYISTTSFYGNNVTCKALNCEDFKDMNNLTEKLQGAHDLGVHLEKTCLELTESKRPLDFYGEDLLRRLLSVIDELLSGGAFNDNRKVSTFLDIVEHALGLIGPFIRTPGTKMSSNHTELALRVHKGAELPMGAVTASSKHARLDMQMETAAGDPSYYPGFTTLSLLSYGNLEDSADGFFGEMKPPENHSFKINSKVVTVTVSNRNTSHLNQPVKLTLYHLRQLNNTSHCVFWNSSLDGGAWSPSGCSVVESNPNYTVCSCTHLSSFAVLMALYDIKNKFELQLITWVGLPLSLICLFMCILTFSLIRSIKSPRTTIHLHLCISLFIAILIFLAGIARTENRVGCAVVAGLLHFFFLAAFCWMCLEGIQLFRMVVLVFNTHFKTSYMMAGGYGVPAVIVAISALANPKGYGTETYCWLNLEFIWSFFGPACVIITVNIFFFLITVWKLAQKFSSLNPDLDNLQKIKAFTITAVAQLCVLATMWIFGCFQFKESTIVMSYLFTIFGSLQGVMLFVMHCLCSKQVREEYRNILHSFCAPQKNNYSEFSYSNSRKAHASKSSQDTGESQI